MNVEQAARLSQRLTESNTEWRPLDDESKLRAFIDEARRSPVEDAFSRAQGLILETGTVIQADLPPGTRRRTFLAETHYTLVAEEDVHERLADYLATVASAWSEGSGPNLTLITGPSRTADIEKIIVLGAHGPRRLMLATAPGHLIQRCLGEDIARQSDQDRTGESER